MTENTDKGRWLFVQFDENWTAEQLNDAAGMIGEETPEDVGVVFAPDTVSYLNKEQVEQFIENLKDAISDD